jgi:hypothetical protein
MNRYVLLIVVGFLVSVALSTGMSFYWRAEIASQPSNFGLSFLASLLEDIVFFGLVGTAALLAQFYFVRGEILRKRVQNLFSNPDVSYPAIAYIEDQVRTAAIYCSSASTTLEVLEYREDLRAYRVSFHNRYVLRNMFGDVAYEADLSAEIAPDLVRDNIRPLAEVVVLRVTHADGRVENFVDGPVEIEKDGHSQPITLRLPRKGEAVYEMEWWSWTSNRGNSGFSIKRFSEDVRVQLKNRTNHLVAVADNADGMGIRYLRYGEEALLASGRNVPPSTRLEFWWYPPKGHETEADPDFDPNRLHPVLQSHRPGEEPKEQI